MRLVPQAHKREFVGLRNHNWGKALKVSFTRNHIHEARCVERMADLGYRLHKGTAPLREQAEELRVVESVIRDEIKLNRAPEGFSTLMKRARRKF